MHDFTCVYFFYYETPKIQAVHSAFNSAREIVGIVKCHSVTVFFLINAPVRRCVCQGRPGLQGQIELSHFQLSNGGFRLKMGQILGEILVR